MFYYESQDGPWIKSMTSLNNVSGVADEFGDRKAFQHSCPNCDKTYSYKKNLKRHLRHECGVKPTEHCTYCPYVTRYKHSLKSHIKTQHAYLQTDYQELEWK